MSKSQTNHNMNPVVVIGSGIAGLNFALNVAEKRHVVILTKKKTIESSTNHAQGGIAAVLNDIDNFEKHVNDTLKAGAFHNNKKVVEFMVKKGPSVIKRLIDFGVHFQTFEGRLALTREGGHSENRIAFVGDYTGNQIEEALIENVKKHPRIKIIEHAFCADLYMKSGIVKGIYYVKKNSVHFIASDAVVIATGGIGQLYKYTTNPDISTGDGLSMAKIAGAKFKDLEFVQFHPTAFIPEDHGTPFLISEAVRGEGAVLRNFKKDRFINELWSRDKVALAIHTALKQGPVYLDATHLKCDFLRLRFPSIYQNLKNVGYDLCTDLIPIKPAAHYLCGGIVTDLCGRTSVKGLFAFGESAYTGVHGANRLASNSLLEALVFSSETASELSRETKFDARLKAPKYELQFNSKLNLDRKIAELKDLMWDKVGIVRSAKGLQEARKRLKALKSEFDENKKSENMKLEKVLTYRNMLIVSGLVTDAALKRKKSLGCHTILRASLSDPRAR